MKREAATESKLDPARILRRFRFQLRLLERMPIMETVVRPARNAPECPRLAEWNLRAGTIAAGEGIGRKSLCRSDRRGKERRYSPRIRISSGIPLPVQFIDERRNRALPRNNRGRIDVPRGGSFDVAKRDRVPYPGPLELSKT